MDRFVIRKTQVLSTTTPNTSQNPVVGEPTPSTSTAQLAETVTSATGGSNRKKQKLSSGRKYDDSYLKFGFCAFNKDGYVVPQCVICGELLANESLKPSKLKRHLETKHTDVKEKSLDYFQRLKQEMNTHKTAIKKYSTVSQSALKASFLVSYRIAKCLKPYTVGEELILPAAIDICATMLSEQVANQLKVVPLSDTTVARRVSAISDDLRNLLVSRLSSVKFSLQLDESTDIANEAILLSYVRYCYNNTIHEDFLFSTKLDSTTTGKDIFAVLMHFCTTNNINMQNCVAITTDGAAAMSGKHVGFAKLLQDVVPDIKWTHCILHREALASKRMSSEFHEVLAEAVKVVNYIKANALNSRLFGILCVEMGSLHKALLLHTEVRWLSRGRCLQRIFELRHEVLQLLNNKRSSYTEFFNDSKWILKLAYLADIFNLLNELNLSLQGENFSIFDHAKKVESFQKKLRLLRAKVTSGKTDVFPSVSDFLEEDSSVSFEDVEDAILQHLEQLQNAFKSYFPEDIRKGHEWIENPFSVDVMTVNLDSHLENQLIELSCDNRLKTAFNESSLELFWAHLTSTSDYAELSAKAVSSLLIFPTTYLCEKGFSTMTNLKTKSRNRLQSDDDMRVALCHIQPRWDRLCSEHQAQVSH